MGVSLLLAHLLAAYAILVEPVLGARTYASLKRDVPHDRNVLVRFYRLIIAVEWSWVLVAALILLLSGLPPRAIGLGWETPPAMVFGFIAALLAGALIPVVVLAWRSRGGDQPGLETTSQQRMLDPVSALLPSTRRERWYFAVMAVTAGICEEVLFRGFLIFYLSEIFPGLPITAAVIVSSIAFGLAHVYQGIGGVLGTGAFGLGMAVLYVWSGSLILPIILHALLDLRVLLIHRPEKQGS